MIIRLMSDQTAYLAHLAAQVVNPELPDWEEAHVQTEAMRVVRGYADGALPVSGLYEGLAWEVFKTVLVTCIAAKPPAQRVSVQGFDVGKDRKFNGQ